MKPKFIYLLLLQFLLVAVLVFLPTIIISRTDQSIDTNAQLLPLTDKYSFTKTIKSKHQFTDSLKLHLKNPLIQNNSRIYVDILDPLGVAINEFVIYGSNVGDPSWINFDFAPLTTTDYQVKIHTDNSNDQQLFIYTNSNREPDIITTYKPPFNSRLNSVASGLYQSIINTHKFYLLSYIIILLCLNILLYKSLHDK